MCQVKKNNDTQDFKVATATPGSYIAMLCTVGQQRKVWLVQKLNEEIIVYKTGGGGGGAVSLNQSTLRWNSWKDNEEHSWGNLFTC